MYKKRKIKNTKIHKKKKNIAEWRKETLVSVAKLAIVLLVITVFIQLFARFVAFRTQVSGYSMTPTLNDSDKVLVSRSKKIQRFDVVAFKLSEGENGAQQFIKRVIGLPGDKISYKNGKLYLNDHEHEEVYLKPYEKMIVKGQATTEDFSLLQKTGVKVVPKNSYFVMGDNRKDSQDSRTFGYVKKEALIGIVKYRLQPIKNIGKID